MEEAIQVCKESGWHYTAIENIIIDTDKLNIYEKMTLIVLCRFADIKSKTCFPSLKTIAVKAGASKSTVQKSLKTLQEKGFIDISARLNDKDGNQSNIYTIKDNYIVLYRQEIHPIPSDTIGLYRDAIYPIPSDTTKQEPVNKSQSELSIPFAEIKNAFNEICVSLPKVKQLTDSRKAHVKARLTEIDNNIDELFEIFGEIEASDFLTNRKKDNRNNWKASFDWIFNPNNFTKIIEGKYDNKEDKNWPVKRRDEPEVFEC